MKRGMLIGIAAGGVVLILLWYFLLFSPTSSDLNDTRDQVSEAQHQKQELENTVRRLKDLSRNAPQQEADLRTLKAAVPDNPDLGEFILQANEIATASGVDWLAITPSPPVASTGSGPNSTIGLSIQVEGGFFQVLDYLNRLEDLDRLVIVDSVSISTGGSGSSTGSSASSTGSTDTSGSSSSDPTLSVTLTGRMFTNAEAAPVAGSSTGSSSSGTTTPTTPSTTPSSGSSTSGGNS
jgi:Tfp pilus assembly protein PilO